MTIGLPFPPFPQLTTIKAPFPWFGGKSRAASLIWSRLGNCANYVEPFAGSLAVLLSRETAPRIETVNDRDAYLANFWRATQSDPEQVAHYADWPVNECDLHARHKWLVEQPIRQRLQDDPEHFDAKVAGWWVWGISQWIGSGWCSRPEWEGRGQGGRAPRGLNTVDARRPNAHNMGLHCDGVSKRPIINRGGRGVLRTRGSVEWDVRPDLRAPMGLHANFAKIPRIDRTGAPGIQSASHKRPHLSGNGATGVHTISNPILDWMYALADRLRRVRVCCGEWSRVVTPSCTWKVGGGMICGVLLDPPYSHDLRDRALYSYESDISHQVRDWAIANGTNQRMRIALCGLDGEHDLPESWEKVYWSAPRGYSNKAKTGARREAIWFSPHCLRQPSLLDGVEGVPL